MSAFWKWALGLGAAGAAAWYFWPKTAWALSSTSLPSTLPPAQPPTNSLPPLLLTETSNGTTVNVRAGSLVILRLPSNPTTGFSWESASSGNLGAPEIAYVPDPVPAGTIGSGGTSQFTWTASAAALGKNLIRLDYKQPWDKTRTPVRQFTLTLNVTP